MKVHVDWPRGAAPKPEDIAAAAAMTTSTGPAQIQALAAINERAAELHAAGMLGPAWETAAVQLLAESNAAPNGG